MGKTFDRVAPILVNDLMKELGLKDFQAAGFVGNFGAESGLISGRQEGTKEASSPAKVIARDDGSHPIGGIDWAQWTASRRVDFYKFLKANGLLSSYPSYEASLAFLLHELTTSYKHAVEQVKKTTSLKAATETAEAHYEKAGIKNMASRYEFAQRALDLYRASDFAKEPDDPLIVGDASLLAGTVFSLLDSAVKVLSARGVKDAFLELPGSDKLVVSMRAATTDDSSE